MIRQKGYSHRCLMMTIGSIYTVYTVCITQQSYESFSLFSHSHAHTHMPTHIYTSLYEIIIRLAFNKQKRKSATAAFDRTSRQNALSLSLTSQIKNLSSLEITLTAHKQFSLIWHDLCIRYEIGLDWIDLNVNVFWIWDKSEKSYTHTHTHGFVLSLI